MQQRPIIPKHSFPIAFLYGLVALELTASSLENVHQYVFATRKRKKDVSWPDVLRASYTEAVA
jgi:hypothetical protein